MKIEIAEKEITAGVRLALEQTLGLKLAGKSFNVDYSMGRGKNGLSATVTVSDGQGEPVETEDKPEEAPSEGTVGAVVAEASKAPVPKEPVGATPADVPEAKTEVVEAAASATAPEVAETAAAGDEENLFG